MAQTWHVGLHHEPGSSIVVDHSISQQQMFVTDLVSEAELQERYGSAARIERIIGQYRAATGTDGSGAVPRGPNQLPLYWRLRLDVWDDDSSLAGIYTQTEVINTRRAELDILRTDEQEERFMWQRDHSYSYNWANFLDVDYECTWGMPSFGTPPNAAAATYMDGTQNDPAYCSLDVKVNRALRFEEGSRLVLLGCVPDYFALNEMGIHQFQFVIRVLISHG